jgi:hypothetical protein
MKTMDKRRGRVISRRFAEAEGSLMNEGKRANINRIKTINMLKAIIRYLNFKGNTPIIIHRYVNDRRNIVLRQRWDMARGME